MTKFDHISRNCQSDRRLIERFFPFELVSEAASKETAKRRGNISNIHQWWARRPLVASRASIAAALLTINEAQHHDFSRFHELIHGITSFPPSSSQFKDALTSLKQVIVEQHHDTPPKILDPFAGGGSIPLEALRLGCETFAVEYNPVATLILKATLELPFKYSRGRMGLASDVERWGIWIWKIARRLALKWYLHPLRGSEDTEQRPQRNGKDNCINEPLAFIWVPFITCPNPSCGQEIPLVKQFWLAKKGKKRVILAPHVNEKEKKTFLQVIELQADEPLPFDPSKGTINRAKARCLSCGHVTDSKTVKLLFKNKKYEDRLVVIVEQSPSGQKQYRRPREEEIERINDIETALSTLKQELTILLGGMDPLPNEYLNPRNPEQDSHGTRCIKYDFMRFSDLFTTRQQFMLLTLMKVIKTVEQEITTRDPLLHSNDRHILLTYLALLFSSLTNHCSRMQRWVTNWEVAAATFSRQVIPMVWDHVELNVLHPKQGWRLLLSWMVDTIRGNALAMMKPSTLPTIQQGSALTLPYSSDTFDAVITDPPYDDNIAYSELADFFYVWLKRLLRSIYPQLFRHPLSPKSQELIVNPSLTDNKTEARRIFQDRLTKAFQEIQRVLKPGGIAVIVYAHQSIDAWKAFINAIAHSGLIVTAAWPIKTEMTKRLRAKNSAALTSTIYLVARKLPKKPPIDVVTYQQILQKELKQALAQCLKKHPLSNTEAFMILLGRGLHVLTQFEAIYRLDGSILTNDDLLMAIQHIMATTILNTIRHARNDFQLSNRTQLYLTWRWLHDKKMIPHDEARMLCQAFGIDVRDLVKEHLAAKKGTHVYLIPLHQRIDVLKKSDVEQNDQISLLDSFVTTWTAKKELPPLDPQELATLDLLLKFLLECVSERDPERRFIEQLAMVLQAASPKRTD